jgi:hypothetical protein
MQLNIFCRLPVIVSLLLLALNGCVAIQPFPNYARGGDTITLAVGSQDRMTLDNTQVYFASDANPSTQLDITGNVRSIFHLYADKASRVYSPNYSNANTNFQHLRHEQWQTVIALDLPQGLALGPATISVQTTAPRPPPLEPGFDIYPDVNTVPIRLEILPGSGAPNPLQYKTTFGGTLSGNYWDLEPATQAQIKPPIEDPQSLWPTTFGAVEMKLNLPMSANGGGALTENNIRLAIQDISNFTRSKLQTTWSLNGNELIVAFISTSGKIRYYEPRFSVMAEAASFTGTPTIQSVGYFDVNGNVVTGPLPGDYTVNVIVGPP